ncbi:MAG: hypothetical protein JJU34_00720 [Lunatimonas sp.]|uniref:hypothetical protein n=1 Tax=Lunatimonas sp. TaxID=2060141 RepID=UPI00263BAD44|nr:hypothetical protein [Lunatimonas sp.]MCC5935777.1 hypothetical protein [Lunatimonas sp.]
MHKSKPFPVYFLSEVKLLHGVAPVKIILPSGQGIFRFRRIFGQQAEKVIGAKMPSLYRSAKHRF